MNDDISDIISNLSQLAEGSGELWQFKALAASMTRLADQKRAELLSLNPASAIMDRLFAEPDTSKRAALAEELRRETLGKLHDIRWTITTNSNLELVQLQPVGELLAQTYTMLNACAGGKAKSEAEDMDLESVLVSYEYDPDVCLKFVPLSYNHDNLLSMLVDARLISLEDAELFLDILDNVALPYESEVHPNWMGSMRSLVTFVVLGYEVGIFKVDWKQKPQRKSGNTENSPNFQSAIINTFLWKNKKPYEGICRDYVKPVRASTPQFREFMKVRHPKAVKGREVVQDDSLANLDIHGMDDYLSERFPDLDVEVMQIYDDLLARSTLDQG